jgi:hypothetical protein
VNIGERMTALVTENGCLTKDGIETLRRYSDMIACQCPGKMLEILELIRSFEEYTIACVSTFPDDAETHQWLYKAAVNLDKLLCGTIMQLARVEGFLDENNRLIPRNKQA